ncbi:MAG: glycosyltransferase family 39 protein [Chloroflexota bacterium]
MVETHEFLSAGMDDKARPAVMVLGLILLVALAAGVMRLTDLGQIPLSPAEANEALAAWQFWQPGQVAAVAAGSPAYFTLTALLTQVVGVSDTVVRLVPALLGLATCLLPWLWQERLGQVGALVASLLLAVSATGAALSRTAGGHSLAIFATLLLVIAYDNYQESSRPRWRLALAGALGLGLASAPLFYSALATLLIARLIGRVIGPAEDEESPHPSASLLLDRTAGLLWIGVFIALSTLFLWHPAGLGQSAALPVHWFNSFNVRVGEPAWYTPFLALARYEWPLLLCGLMAVAWATWHSEPLPALLVYWLAAGLMLAFLQRDHLENVALLTLPGYLLVGLFVNRQFEQPAGWFRWLVAAVFALVGAMVYVNLARYGRVEPYGANAIGYLWLALIGFFLAVIAFSFAYSWEKGAAVQGALAGLLAVLLAFNWGIAWWLGHVAANDPRERWVTTATDDDVRLLVGLIQEIGRQAANADHGLEIQAAVDSPALRWYLRDFNPAVVGTALPVGVQPDVVITPVASEPQLGSDYLGMDFVLSRTETPTTPTDLAARLRGWLLRQTAETYQQERVILWLRADLARP